MPGIHVQVVDTTGAGDNFNCGFLCGQVRGFSLADSLRMGNICGGLSTQGYGGTTTSPTLMNSNISWKAFKIPVLRKKFYGIK